MNFLVGFLTFLLVINSLVLILLVLVQLPKKDAGAGIAFGGGTADAMFGAGSGNALTKITKYATIVLLGMSFLISVLQDRTHEAHSTSVFEQKVQQNQSQQDTEPVAGQSAPTTTAPAKAPANNFLTAPVTTNGSAAK